jgi:hypothetical protein
MCGLRHLKEAVVRREVALLREVLRGYIIHIMGQLGGMPS